MFSLKEFPRRLVLQLLTHAHTHTHTHTHIHTEEAAPGPGLLKEVFRTSLVGMYKAVGVEYTSEIFLRHNQ